MLAVRQADEDDCVAPTVVRPLPWQFVERDVKVSDPGREFAGGRSADGNVRRFSRRYGMKTTPLASGPASGGSTVRPGAGSWSTSTTVLCATASATSSAAAVAATSVLMSGVIAKSPL